MISDRLLYESPRDWIFDLLAEGERLLAEQSISRFDWLRGAYAERGERFRASVRTGLLAIFAEPPTSPPNERGAVISLALKFVRSAGISEAVETLRALVDARTLTDRIGGYSDLHGRALAALHELDAEFDPMEVWRRESAYPEFAPIAFSFVRDERPEQIADLVPTIAQIGFLKQAIRSIAAEYHVGSPQDRGFQLLHQCARTVAERGDRVTARELELAIATLDLPAPLHLELTRTLQPPVAKAGVLLRCVGPFRDALAGWFEGEGVEVLPGIQQPRTGPVVMVMDYRTVSTPELALNAPYVDAAVAAYSQGVPLPDVYDHRFRIVAVPSDTSKAIPLIGRTVLHIISLLELPSATPSEGPRQFFTPSKTIRTSTARTARTSNNLAAVARQQRTRRR